MYIYIFEDGVICKSNIVTEADKQAVDDGVLDIIDCSTIKQYYDNNWVEILNVND